MSETTDNPPPLPNTQDHLWLPKSQRSPARARRLLRDFLPRVERGELFFEKGSCSSASW